MIVDSLTTKLLAATMAGALILPPVTSAQAGGWDDDAGPLVAAGVIGLAAGTIVGSTLSAPRPVDPVYVQRPYPVYAAPPPVYAPAPVYESAPVYEPVEVYRPAPAYRREVVVQYGPEPWTREWYSYCTTKYRSFDPQTGYYVTYSGTTQLCR